MKKYLNINQVSKILDIEEHVIRYWDSIDPKTKKIRIDGISTKSRGGTRYFNKDNISKLEKVKNLLYENGNHVHSTNLVNKILSSKKFSLKDIKLNEYQESNISTKQYKKIHQILVNMRKLLK